MLNEILERTDTPEEQCKILDLGCDTGNLSKLFLDKYPNDFFVCIDTSSKMLDMASIKLSKSTNRVSIVETDFLNIPNGSYHAVISTLTLHYIGDD